MVGKKTGGFQMLGIVIENLSKQPIR